MPAKAWRCWSQASFGLAITLALPAQAVTDWGWRIAMLLGVVILPIGFHLRRIMPETLTLATDDTMEVEAAALPMARVAVIGLLLILAGTVTTYTLQYLNTYTISVLKLSPRTAFTTTAITGASMFAFGLLGGWLSDRFGRRSVIVVPRIVLLVLIYPVFAHILAHPALGSLALGVFIMTSLYAMSTATANVCLAECFPRARRSTAYALTYAMGVSVFGGGAQFAIVWLAKANRQPRDAGLVAGRCQRDRRDRRPDHADAAQYREMAAKFRHHPRPPDPLHRLTPTDDR